MHFVGRADWSFLERMPPASARGSGFAREVVVGPTQGATHTELAIGGFAGAGWIARHVHSFEEALYVLDGGLILEIDGRVHRLVAADYAVIPVGVPHTLVADGLATARWVSINTPPRRPGGHPADDTVYAREPPDVSTLIKAARPVTGGPLSRLVGHYAGTPPQLDALAVTDPARGRAPAGMDSAILAYSGISVKMLVDRGLGADLLTMFTVDYEVGGAAQVHDHPFEEAYLFLAGEVEGELDGVPYRFRAGDVAFVGVGTRHGFWNPGPERVRWLETQAPQPPVRHAYRWEPTWRRIAEEGIGPWPGAGGSD